jgi:hypothetical protein
MTLEFDIGRFKNNEPPSQQYERQLKRLTDARKEETASKKQCAGPFKTSTRKTDARSSYTESRRAAKPR